MDKQTRKELADLADRLSLIMTQLDIIITYKHQKYDDLPPTILQAEWAGRLEDTIERLDNAYYMMEETLKILQNPDEI